MEKFFKDKVVLITGEISSLGMGIIHSFLKEMAIVIFPAKSLHQVDMVKSFRDIDKYDNLITLIVDLHDFDKVTETCETITEKFGKIDIAIDIPEFSNSQRELTEASIDDWNNMMEKDMLPFFIGARIVLNIMKDNLCGMFVHITDSRFFESPQSYALARVAFTARMEMSKIFAEEAHRHGIRYYHLWARDVQNKKGFKDIRDSTVASADEVSNEIMYLYQKEPYNTQMALQSFPKQMLQPQG